MKFKFGMIASVLMIVALVAMATASSLSYFNDTETSADNTITAGTLDLQIDGVNTNVVKIDIANWKPSSGPYCYTYALTNVGSLNGYLDISNVAVTDLENVLTEPETEAGDVTPDTGELSTLLKMHMFVDAAPSNGYFGFEDTTIYNGYMNTVGTSYNQNLPIAAGQTVYITVQIGWWLGGNDNLAQSDSIDFDLAFQLNQIV
jgi:predicted ribosomally synthesized peptide with SipW-like signal peptide